VGFLKPKISWGLTQLLRKCDLGGELRGLFFPLGPWVWGGSCRRTTPSLGDVGIHLLLKCPSSFQLCLAVGLCSTETDFKYMYLFAIAKRIYILTSCCLRSLNAVTVLLLVTFLWSSKELYVSKVIKKKQTKTHPVQNMKLFA